MIGVTGGTSQNFSQESVQEFQIFDLQLRSLDQRDQRRLGQYRLAQRLE